MLGTATSVIQARRARFVRVTVPFVPRFVEVLVGHIDCDQERVELFGIGVPPRACPVLDRHVHTPHRTGTSRESALAKAKEGEATKTTAVSIEIFKIGRSMLMSITQEKIIGIHPYTSGS